MVDLVAPYSDEVQNAVGRNFLEWVGMKTCENRYPIRKEDFIFLYLAINERLGAVFGAFEPLTLDAFYGVKAFIGANHIEVLHEKLNLARGRFVNPLLGLPSGTREVSEKGLKTSLGSIVFDTSTEKLLPFDEIYTECFQHSNITTAYSCLEKLHRICIEEPSCRSETTIIRSIGDKDGLKEDRKLTFKTHFGYILEEDASLSEEYEANCVSLSLNPDADDTKTVSVDANSKGKDSCFDYYKRVVSHIDSYFCFASGFICYGACSEFSDLKRRDNAYYTIEEGICEQDTTIDLSDSLFDDTFEGATCTVYGYFTVRITNTGSVGAYTNSGKSTNRSYSSQCKYYVSRLGQCSVENRTVKIPASFMNGFVTSLGLKTGGDSLSSLKPPTISVTNVIRGSISSEDDWLCSIECIPYLVLDQREENFKFHIKRAI